MRADEAITIENADSMFVGMNYINQLRVERLMAKAESVRNYGLAINPLLFIPMYHDKELILEAREINLKRMARCNRIAEALEARARRIKEGM